MGKGIEVGGSLRPEELADFDLLSEGLFKILEQDFGFMLPALFMYDEGIKGLRIVKERAKPQVKNHIFLATGRSMADIIFSVNEPENLVVKTYLSKQQQSRDSLEAFGKPFVNGAITRVLDTIMGVKKIISFPLTSGDICFGVVVFASKKDLDANGEEAKILKTISESMAFYLKQTWLLKKILEDRNRLNDYTKELEALIDVKQEFLSQISELLIELSEIFDIDQKKKHDIGQAVRYLKSLFLLTETVKEKKKSL